MSRIVELCKLTGQIGGLTGAAGSLLVTNLMIGASDLNLIFSVFYTSLTSDPAVAYLFATTKMEVG